jgi:hypothetical protein
MKPYCHVTSTMAAVTYDIPLVLSLSLYIRLSLSLLLLSALCYCYCNCLVNSTFLIISCKQLHIEISPPPTNRPARTAEYVEEESKVLVPACVAVVSAQSLLTVSGVLQWCQHSRC